MMTFEHLQYQRAESSPVPFFLDIPEKEKTEEKDPIGRLPESDIGNFRRILECLDAGACVIDMDTCEILYMNPYGKRIFGDVEGRICWQTLQENQSGPCPFCNNSQLLNEQGKPAEVVVRDFQNTRNKRWYECRDRAVYWFGDRVVRLEIAMDVTERKREEEKQARMMRLEALCVLSEKFACDCNDMLSAGMGYLSLARLHVPPDNPAIWFLKKAEDALMKTGELNKQLLALTGECSPSLHKTALDSLLLDSVSLLPGDSGIKNAFVLADQLWPVLIDEDQIRQVIFGLLQNARQAMPQEGDLTIRAENVILGAGEKGGLPAGPYVCWSVEGQGIGIPRDHPAEHFNSGITSLLGGHTQKSFLELDACRLIIERHKGHIQCLSAPGTGTLSIVYLPAVKDS
jgi:signal transduction histidine kinase